MSTDPGSAAAAVFLLQTGHPLTLEITPDVVGGKAYGLLRMVGAGIKVPPGFVLGTACCREYFHNHQQLPDHLIMEIQRQIHGLENITGKGFGSKRNPLIVAVRSGAPLSMPGMLESLLNIGLNEETVRGLIRVTGNPRLAWDSYRRLVQSYGQIVQATGATVFTEVQKHFLNQEGLKYLQEIDTITLRNLCTEFNRLFRSETGEDFPQDPWQQLYRAVAAVFDSWFSRRAVTYRRLNHIDAATGTACLIQAMVFGNSGGNSGSGVGFTRNPANGVNELFVDYLDNAQGEDIVSGRHDVADIYTLQRKLPAVHAELQKIKNKLETEFSDMQDFEFTVYQGELYLLQTRSGKRTPLAALRIAVDLFDEGVIDAAEALALIQDIDLDNLYWYRLKLSDAAVPLATGTIASSGVATGRIALDEERCREYAANGKPIVLVRAVTSTNDIGAMSMVAGMVTLTGGKTSHAAVVARQLGIACIVGCHSLQIDLKRRCLTIGNQSYLEGEYLTVDADHGHIYPGQLEIEKHHPEDLLKRIDHWRATQTKKPVVA